jgi:predicted dehydrogenase
MSSRIVNIGIIGTGSIACDQHAPACIAAGNARLHSVLSRSFKKAQDFAARFSEAGDIQPFDDIADFLADTSLDAVVVASPDSLHFEHAIACLKASKHTLVEKPLALKPEEGCRLIQIAERERCTLGVGFHMRWHPGIQEVLRMLRDGTIGSVRHVDMRWTFLRDSTADWRADPSFSRWWSLSGVGAHCLDLMRLFASEFGWTRLSFSAASVRNVLGSNNEETTAITATFAEGVTAQILSSVLFPSQSELTFFGCDGSISCDGILGRANPGRISLNGVTIHYEFRNPYVRQLEGFCSAVTLKHAYPVSGEVGLHVLSDLSSIA